MRLSFPYEEKASSFLGKIYRPVVAVRIYSSLLSEWIQYTMLPDTGADYTVLPYSMAGELGISLKRDCRKVHGLGVGGATMMYWIKDGLRLRIGRWEQNIPVAFSSSLEIPPLLGRFGCLDLLDIRFVRRITHVAF